MDDSVLRDSTLISGGIAAVVAVVISTIGWKITHSQRKRDREAADENFEKEIALLESKMQQSEKHHNHSINLAKSLHESELEFIARLDEKKQEELALGKAAFDEAAVLGINFFWRCSIGGLNTLAKR